MPKKLNFARKMAAKATGLLADGEVDEAISKIQAINPADMEVLIFQRGEFPKLKGICSRRKSNAVF